MASDEIPVETVFNPTRGLTIIGQNKARNLKRLRFPLHAQTR